VLVAMMLTPPTPSHILLSLLCLLLLQLQMSNKRAFPMMTLPYLQGNFRRCTSFERRGDETPETPRAALSAAIPPTSLPIAQRGRSITIPTRMTTPTRTTTITRTTTRRRIALRTRRRRRSRRSCPEHVQP
jgi:hypothetical protein